MIRIAIAEDMNMLRDSLKFMIESNEEMQVVGLAQNGKEMLAICEKEKPDLVVMDLKMPVMDGLETTKIIKSQFPQIKVMILSTFDDEESVTKAIENGVDGYITKDLGVIELHQSIKSVSLGLRIFQDSALSNYKKITAEIKNNEASDICISEKEKLVLKLIADGKSYKEVGKIIYLSEGTVRNIIYNLLGRFNLKDRIQLIAFAIKNRII